MTIVITASNAPALLRVGMSDTGTGLDYFQPSANFTALRQKQNDYT